MKAYIAGPLFNEHEREFLEKIDAMCRELCISTFLPHRDAAFPDESDAIAIFTADVSGLLECNLVIALLDGQDIDSGTCVEIGIAWRDGLKLVGITTDVIRRAYSNAMPYGACLESLGIAKSLPELEDILRKLLRDSMQQKGE